MWFYNGKEFLEVPEGVIGFIYLIENTTNNKKYIGKKSCYFSKIRRVNKKKKKVKVSSDWADYWSSSDELKKEVKELGESNFRREILHLCTNKMQLNYMELREQIDRRVLESNEYYNEYIFVRIRKTKNLVSGE